MSKGTGSCVAWLLFAVAIGSGSAVPAAGQLEVGASFDGFVNYPEPFQTNRRYCEPRGAGLTVSGGLRLGGVGEVELSNTLTFGVGDGNCAYADLAPIPSDTPYDQLRYPPSIPGASFAATHLALVLEPWPDGALSPRVKAGGGLLWNKELGNWLYGFGVRYRFGRHSLLTELEAWNLTFVRYVDTLIYRSATRSTETLATQEERENARPVAVRIGWRVGVG